MRRSRVTALTLVLPTPMGWWTSAGSKTLHARLPDDDGTFCGRTLFNRKSDLLVLTDRLDVKADPTRPGAQLCRRCIARLLKEAIFEKVEAR